MWIDVNWCELWIIHPMASAGFVFLCVFVPSDVNNVWCSRACPTKLQRSTGTWQNQWRDGHEWHEWHESLFHIQPPRVSTVSNVIYRCPVHLMKPCPGWLMALWTFVNSNPSFPMYFPYRSWPKAYQTQYSNLARSEIVERTMEEPWRQDPSLRCLGCFAYTTYS